MATAPPTTNRQSRLASSAFIYDVYLCFDNSILYSFIGFLNEALSKNNFITFFHELEITEGRQITQEHFGAIEKSRIFLIVFSANYAGSTFRLDELVKILDFTKGKHVLVLPVFYFVDPCQLKYLTGDYGEAFARHQEMCPDRVEKWKPALREIADFKGWHITNGGAKLECQWISEIVKNVNRHDGLLHDALLSQVNKIVSLLNLESDGEVYTIGFLGNDNISIMTMARLVYKQHPDRFDILCILDNVKESSIKFGLKQLKEKLISKIVGRHIKIDDVNERISLIKYMLHQKKVLLVLHNVGKLEELQAIIGQTDWLGSGSRVIITTQDQSLLTSHRVDRIYNEDDIVHENKEYGNQSHASNDGGWDPIELEQPLPPLSSSLLLH